MNAIQKQVRLTAVLLAMPLLMFSTAAADPLPGRPGSIVEEMPQMSVAPCAQNLRSLHPQTSVVLSTDVLFFQRSVKTGPARS